MNYKIRQEFHQDNEFKIASIKKRFIAFLIDWIVLVLVYLGIIILFDIFDMNISTINVHSFLDDEIEMTNTQSYLITLLKFLFGILPFMYFSLLFYFFKGQTIGKYLLRIRVLSLYHEKLGLWHCIERSLGSVLVKIDMK